MDSNNSYLPKVHDYVKWTDSLGRVTEGWVYFADSAYITIEVGVKDKPHCEYTLNEKHKKVHILVVCPQFMWHELEYVRNRRDNNVDEYKSQQYRHKDP